MVFSMINENFLRSLNSWLASSITPYKTLEICGIFPLKSVVIVFVASYFCHQLSFLQWSLLSTLVVDGGGR